MTGMAAQMVLIAALLAARALGQTAAADGLKRAAAGDFDSAERLLKQAVTAAPTDAELRYRLGLVLLRQKKFSSAQAQLETAAKLNPGVASVWLALAHVRLEKENATEARRAAAQARKLGGADPGITRGLASFFRQLAQASRARRDFAGAVNAWQEAIALAPREASLYSELAGFFLDHRTPEPAIAVLTTAAARLPANAELLRLLGLAYYTAGETGKAIDAFLHLMDVAPDAEESYTSVETLLPEAGEKLDDIMARLRRFAAARPESPVGYFLVAQALAVSAPGSSQVENLLRESIRVEPAFWPAHYEMHKGLVARGEMREAALALERAVDLNPTYAPARYALAQVYAALGDRAKAMSQRQAHHELVTKERTAAQARTAEMPPLPYQVLRP